jgi:hypothetical protein
MVKRSKLGQTAMALLGDSTNMYLSMIGFGWTSVDDISVLLGDGSSQGSYITSTSSLYRDVSAWYDICVAVDTTNSTASERVRIFVNGTRQSVSAGGTTPQNFVSRLNKAGVTNYVGYTQAYNYFDGYMAECYLIDGQALDPSYFGQLDSSSGQWIPKAYSGTYGVNGFYLKLADNSATTAATLGKDSSPNGNNWTPTNFNTYDQVLDSPTNNFCTLNSLVAQTSVTHSNGNLTAAYNASGDNSIAIGTLFASSGKWRAAFSITGANTVVGVTTPSVTASGSSSPGAPAAQSPGVWYNGSNGTKQVNGTATAYGSTFTSGKVVTIDLDCDAQTVTFSVDGNSQGALALPTSGQSWTFAATQAGLATWQVTVNFGQGGQTGVTYDAASGGRFKYTPPSGFKALSTANLPAPTIKNGGQYFNVMKWTGDGGSSKSVSGLAFQPDFVWSKARDATYDHFLYDSVRGAGKALISNQASPELTAGVGGFDSGHISSFDANGFSFAKGTTAGSYTNELNKNYVAWCWKAGTSWSNSAGTGGATVASSGSRNTTAGFSIASWTHTTSTNYSIAHGLTTAPSFVITKSRNEALNWDIWHKNLTSASDRLIFNSINEISGYWANPANSLTSGGPPETATLHGVASTDANGADPMIGYFFAEVDGFSKFGFYTGNGSADGPFVYCGFKPRFILWKRSDSTSDWVIFDSSISPNNVVSKGFRANTTDGENTIGNGNYLDVTANGFKFRDAIGFINVSGGTYIFAAFAEASFKYATAR